LGSGPSKSLHKSDANLRVVIRLMELWRGMRLLFYQLPRLWVGGPPVIKQSVRRLRRRTKTGGVILLCDFLNSPTAKFFWRFFLLQKGVDHENHNSV
jgi:hypothetical protein